MTRFRDLTVPRFAITVDGNTLPVAAQVQLSSIRVDEDSLLPSTFALEFASAGADQNQTEWIDGSLFPIGGTVDIKLGYRDELATVLVAEITGLEPLFRQGAPFTLTVRGYDRRHRLLRRRKTRTFVQQKDSDIASAVASEAGLTASVTDSEIVHEYVIQANQTDMEFLQERAERINYELSMDDRTLHFRPVQNGQGEVLTVTPQDDLLEFRPCLTTMGQVTEIEVRGWNVKDKKEIVGQAKAGDEVGSMGGQETGAALAQRATGSAPVLLNRTPVSQAEADQMARAGFNRALLTLIRGDGVCNGRTDLRPGTVIKLDGIGSRFSGQYYIRATTHRYTPSEAYQTLFIAWRNAS